MSLMHPIDMRKVMEFYSDDTFKFVNLPVHDGSVIKKVDTTITHGWPLINRLTMIFHGHEFGFKKPERILIISEMDIIDDVFNILPPGEKPETGPQLVKDYVKDKAESVLYRHQAKPKSTNAINMVVIFLGIALSILGIIALIGVLR